MGTGSKTVLPLLLAALALAGCAPRASKVPDLAGAKQEVRRYVESGRYEADLARVAGEAREALDKRLASSADGKPAMVLDIDETSLSNWPYEAEFDFGHDWKTWHEWIARAEATAIRPTLELYRHARGKGVAVFFITGRRENERKATEKNLVAAGFTDWEELIMKPDDYKGPAAPFKAEARKRLAGQGWRIVLNVGDQQSDLEGGHAEAAFLLPNPFYRVP